MTNISVVRNDLTVKNDMTFAPILQGIVENVRSDMRDNPYILEAIKVLPVQGYRSAIVSFWNAVVDDLRNKIIYRSIDLFNKEIKPRKEIKNYEDFQNYVNDDELIDGAYKIGVISWEASKILRHAKETRHIFDGHPKSSDPDILKVLSMFNDCIKYVLNEEYPSKIINIDEYIKILETNSFDKNEIAVSNAFSDLPEIYKKELINRMFDIYTYPTTTSTFSSNIEFSAPILWNLLGKEIHLQVVRRVDQKIIDGNIDVTDRAFSFVNLVKANKYLSQKSREYKLFPLIKELKDSTHIWSIENKCVKLLEPYSDIIPVNYISDYVFALTHTYIGKNGSSYQYSRTDFYADEASLLIPKMFESFDSSMVIEFVNTIRNSDSLKRLIHTPSKLRRIKNLALIISDKAIEPESKEFIDMLLMENNEEQFFKKYNL